MSGSPDDPGEWRPSGALAAEDLGLTAAQAQLGREMALLVAKVFVSSSALLLATLPSQGISWESVNSDPAQIAVQYSAAFLLGFGVLHSVTTVATLDAVRSYLFLEAVRHRLVVQLRPARLAGSLSDWLLVLGPLALAIFLAAYRRSGYSNCVIVAAQGFLIRMTIKSHTGEVLQRCHAAAHRTLRLWATEQSSIATVSEGRLVRELMIALGQRIRGAQRESVIERAFRQCLSEEVSDLDDDWMALPEPPPAKGHPDRAFIRGLRCQRCCKGCFCGASLALNRRAKYCPGKGLGCRQSLANNPNGYHSV